MAKILLQTTIPYAEDDWHIGRFSLLRDYLANQGHQMTARDRTPLDVGDDEVLTGLPNSGFDQLWLFAVDTGGGLSDKEAQAILNFRRLGGGILTARDHQDLGASLEALGSLGAVNYFHSYHSEPDRQERDDQDNPDISWPNYHSGANGEYQRIRPVEPVHELLRSERAAGGVIVDFPAHPHEGAVGVSEGVGFERLIAQGRSTVTGRHFNLAVIIDGEYAVDGVLLGRAVAESTFHHFADLNWDVDRGAPSFVKDKPGSEIKRDPARLEIFKDYVGNVARWLGVRERKPARA